VLVLQDPTNEQGPYLLESLTNALRSADQIAGVFAFASSAGVQLLSGDEAFKKVAREGTVDLIVGTDAVTNVRALDALGDVASQFPGMRARAFLNPKPEGLFHPKFCFTRKRGSGHLIAGSGNLTAGGLLGNWEAHSVDELNTPESAVTKPSWNSWTVKYDASLSPLDTVKVRVLASGDSTTDRKAGRPTVNAPVQSTGPMRRAPIGGRGPATVHASSRSRHRAGRPYPGPAPRVPLSSVRLDGSVGTRTTGSAPAGSPLPVTSTWQDTCDPDGNGRAHVHNPVQSTGDFRTP
jgi:HKD family nuclease